MAAGFRSAGLKTVAFSDWIARHSRRGDVV